jgi:hypothetical protein
MGYPVIQYFNTKHFRPLTIMNLFCWVALDTEHGTLTFNINNMKVKQSHYMPVRHLGEEEI